jgi:hypothetical protein
MAVQQRCRAAERREAFYEGRSEQLELYAKAYLKLHVGGDHTTLENLLVRAERAGNKDRIEELEKELQLPYLPPDLYPLWLKFLRLSRRRDYGDMGGLKLIRHTEIVAFQQLSGVAFTPWEIEQIEILDNVYISVVSEARRDDSG